jgi:hypothetical protein
MEQLIGCDFFVYYDNLPNNNKIIFTGEEHMNTDINGEMNSIEIHYFYFNLSRLLNERLNIYLELPSFHNSNDYNIESLKFYKTPIYAIFDILNKYEIKNNKIDIRFDNEAHPFMIIQNLVLYENDNDAKINYENAYEYFKQDDNKIKLFLYITGINKSEEYKLIYDTFFLLMTNNMEESEFLEGSLDLIWSNIQEKLNSMIIEVDFKQIVDIFIHILNEMYNDKGFTWIFDIHMDIIFILDILNKISTNNNVFIVHTGSRHSKLYSIFIEKYFNIEYSVLLCGDNNLCQFETPFDIKTLL